MRFKGKTAIVEARRSGQPRSALRPEGPQVGVIDMKPSGLRKMEEEMKKDSVSFMEFEGYISHEPSWNP